MAKHDFYGDVIIHDGFKSNEIVGAPQGMTLAKACDITNKLQNTYIATNGFEFNKTEQIEYFYAYYLNDEYFNLTITNIPSTSFAWAPIINYSINPKNSTEAIIFNYYATQGEGEYRDEVTKKGEIAPPYQMPAHEAVEIYPELNKEYTTKISNSITVPIQLDAQTITFSKNGNNSISYRNSYNQGIIRFEYAVSWEQSYNPDGYEDYNRFTVSIYKISFVLPYGDDANLSENITGQIELVFTPADANYGATPYTYQLGRVIPLSIPYTNDKATITMDTNSLTQKTKDGLLPFIV